MPTHGLQPAKHRRRRRAIRGGMRTPWRVRRKEAFPPTMWGQERHFMGPDNEIGTEGERTDAEAPSASQVVSAERTDELAKAYEELKRAEAELQRRWQYLA